MATFAEQNAIVCLQELPLQWTGKFQALFAKRNFTLIATNYGEDYSDYMGVGLAFPNSLYSLGDCCIETLGAGVPNKKKQPPPGKVMSALSYLARTSAKIVTWNWKAPPTDPWTTAARRKNRAIAIKLIEKEQQREFWVTTYHMPCCFWSEEIMLIHSSLYAQFAQRQAGGAPVIITGDFNIKPQDKPYDLLTTNDQNIELQPPAERQNGSFTIKLDYALTSAHAAVHGKEPPYTNWALNKNSPVFKETLDYILFSDAKLHVKECNVLISDGNEPGPYPNDSEPSDHVPVEAVLEWK
eukprot:TRINITY_DN77348_c0_g1_i1.p1 TRINITY_DN77348_c0_g1~~TRINITY_DN77348_c0_g1_i1.p1  ORF type:complete len:340 (-),score=41.03 TRINITY_DN77348_c0_g1_i1:145-1035(-)